MRWAAAYPFCSRYADNDSSYPEGGFRNLLAVGREALPLHALDDLQTAHDRRPDWLFGYLSYDLKNQLERLHSRNPDAHGYPPLQFYRPETVIERAGEKLYIHSLADPEQVWQQLSNQPVTNSTIRHDSQIKFRSSASKEEYLQNVARIRQYILEGDCYELNYCLQYAAEGARIDPVAIFERLNALSPMPFAAFQRMGERYLLCASPERFLKKSGRRLVSQPIKGTAPRGATPPQDRANRLRLFQSEKERAENLMIVDLVRNDLARCSDVGTVEVPELFGLYAFPQVHQMISTVTGQLREGLPFSEALRCAFPMGSMTGAPKVRAMQRIEELETFRRGLYSGAVGYLTPDGDFDFNVVIRSLLYHAGKGALSFAVGGAVTYDSDSQAEYQECLLKAQAIRQALSAR